MKARLYCCIPINADGRLMRICRKAKLFDADASTIQNFNKYLLASLDTDFPFYCMKGLQRVLCDIEKMEGGESNTAYWKGAMFYHNIGKSKVTFEHAIFGKCPDWPIWSCTLEQYKAALRGWHGFLQMPVSEESEMLVEIPEGLPD